MWNDLKKNLSATQPYFKLLFLFNFFVIALIFVINSTSYLILSILALILLGSIFLNFIGRKRKKELNTIQNTIENIKTGVYKDSEDIKLNKHLSDLELKIKEMFVKGKGDLNYLKKLEKIRTEFLANVSHELRTPIFAIQGYIETLLDGAIDDKKVNRSFLEKANQHTINLNNLINDLIDISMIESGEMRMSFRYFRIKDYLKEIVEVFIPLANGKNIDLIYYPVKNKLQIFADKEKLRQALVNLITNAIKYTEKGKVEILVEEEKGFAKIIVRDTGIGISEEDINRIFERFFRVDKNISRAVGGTGLGLAIVKHIIEAHGSKIEVKSILGTGSEFSIKLKK